MHGDGSLMWTASVMSGGRIFATATTLKSEKNKPVVAFSFAKSTAVTTNMGTMPIRAIVGSHRLDVALGQFYPPLPTKQRQQDQDALVSPHPDEEPELPGERTLQ